VGTVAFEGIKGDGCVKRWHHYEDDFLFTTLRQLWQERRFSGIYQGVHWVFGVRGSDEMLIWIDSMALLGSLRRCD
jgi:hypothetical protein